MAEEPQLIAVHATDDPDDRVPWAPRELARRFSAQAKRLGVGRSTLAARAGHGPNAIHDLEKGIWPNLKKLTSLTRTFQFERGLPEVLGIADTPQTLPYCRVDVLHKALELVAHALDLRKGRDSLRDEPHVIALLTATTYNHFLELLAIDPHALDSAVALRSISLMLRDELANRARSKS